MLAAERGGAGDGMRLATLWRIALAAAWLAFSCANAAAQDAAAFFKGRTVRIVVGFGPGGGYDLYARLLAKHLGAHLPGAPNIVVENMEGVGSVRAANYVYEAAPRDGSVIAAVNQNAPMYQLLGGAGARFRAEQTGFIGSLAHSNEVLFTWRASGVVSLADARAREVVLGAVAVTSDSYIYPTVLNALIGTRFRVVNGYAGGQALNLAVERGEVMGRGGESFASLASSRPDWLAQKKINILVQVGPQREPELGDVPLLADLIANAADRDLADVISLPTRLGYSYWLPPGVPPDRLAALRAAFAAAAADPALRAEAAARRIIIRPQSGGDIAALVQQAAATPPEVIAKAVKLLGWK
jgi:tripartite-type tricarboxylate transporter receptor subunit TctC